MKIMENNKKYIPKALGLINKTVNLIELKSKLNLSNNIECLVCMNIVNKIKKLSEDYITGESILLYRASTVRYILEALISLKLILNDKNNAYTLYYLGKIELYEKCERIIEKIKTEITILKRLEEKENCLIDKIETEKSNYNEYINKIKEIEKIIDKEIDDEISLYAKDAKINGCGFQIALVEENALPYYQNVQQKIMDSINLFKTDELFNSRYKFDSDIKELKKNISSNINWREKAKRVGLEREYTHIYDYTSSLMHFTPYSIMTETNLLETEETMLSNYMYQYLMKINAVLTDIVNKDLNINLNKIKVFELEK
jgi:hypothetical protein